MRDKTDLKYAAPARVKKVSIEYLGRSDETAPNGYESGSNGSLVL